MNVALPQIHGMLRGESYRKRDLPS